MFSLLGYNYRISNDAAGIGRGRLKVLANRVAKKRYTFDYYKQALGSFDGLEFMPVMIGIRRIVSLFIFTWKCLKQVDVIEVLEMKKLRRV